MSRSNRRSVLKGIGAGTAALLGVAGARPGRRAGASAETTITELAAASDDLATILLYHVTEGRRYADSVVNAPAVELGRRSRLRLRE